MMHPQPIDSQNPWYESQSDVGLPMTFDDWRAHYDRLTYREQVDFYRSVYEKFPNQHVATDELVRQFISQLPAGSTVLEIGGGLGQFAEEALQSSNIRHWYNYEISPTATANGLKHARYTAVVTDDFVWNLSRFPPCDTLFASHVFEHIRASQIDRLLDKLPSVTRAYVECPIASDAKTFDWSGRWNTHILEVGWKQLESLFAAHAYEVAHRDRDVRWFRR